MKICLLQRSLFGTSLRTGSLLAAAVYVVLGAALAAKTISRKLDFGTGEFDAFLRVVFAIVHCAVVSASLALVFGVLAEKRRLLLLWLAAVVYHFVFHVSESLLIVVQAIMSCQMRDATMDTLLNCMIVFWFGQCFIEVNNYYESLAKEDEEITEI